MVELVNNLLTIEALEEMAPDSIFGTGIILNPAIHRDRVRWVAVRRGAPDWSIYYSHAHLTPEQVACDGDKMFTKSVIRQLVNCTDAAWAKYAL